MICFCTLGTSSGGISTPRSPRATISASASSMISSSRPIAAGFSSLTRSPAALPISFLPSATSSGRCTKDSATQSAPCSSANDRSARSFSVIAEIGSTDLRHVDALVVGQGAADEDLGVGEIGAAIDDPEPHLAVVEQELGSGRERREDLRDAAAARAPASPETRVEVEAKGGAGDDARPGPRRNCRAAASGPADRRGCRSAARYRPRPGGFPRTAGDAGRGCHG